MPLLTAERHQIEWKEAVAARGHTIFKCLSVLWADLFAATCGQKKCFFSRTIFRTAEIESPFGLKQVKKWQRIVNKCIRSVVKVNLLAHKISFSFSMKKTDGLHFVTCRPFPCNRRVRWLPLVSSVRHVYLSGRFGLRFRNNSVTLCHENHD